MRVSVAVEKCGVPTASIITSGFVLQAKTVAKLQGLENLSIAEYPGVVMTDSKEELRKKVETVLVDNVINGLTSIPASKPTEVTEPEPRDIVYKGDLRQVNEYFYQNLWSDGLPIIPPTLDEVERFLKFTDRSPDEVIGILPPENREATIWNIAVNGVMAGCRPEYMPILIAIVEAISDPAFRIQDGGTTPGWEPLIVLNGPIIKELDFNYGQGVMRIGRQANTSVGRFLRLYMRNIAGLRIPPGLTDKGSIAQNFNVVLAENEDAVKEIGWQPFSVDRGFSEGDNVVTVLSSIFAGPPTYSAGNTALEHMETIADVIGRKTVAYWAIYFVLTGVFDPLLVLSPSVAKAIAKDGWTKDDVREYLRRNVKTTAEEMQRHTQVFQAINLDLCALVAEGHLPKEYCESTDPKRQLPVFQGQNSPLIVVSGDPARNQSKVYVQSGYIGPPTSRKIVLPKDWRKLLDEISYNKPNFCGCEESVPNSCGCEESPTNCTGLCESFNE